MNTLHFTLNDLRVFFEGEILKALFIQEFYCVFCKIGDDQVGSGAFRTHLEANELWVEYARRLGLGYLWFYVGHFRTGEFWPVSGDPAKVDARFMAVALSTYFTSSSLAGDVASDYGFNVTDTGIGTKIVNVGDSGEAFDTDDGSNLTIMQLLEAVNDLTDLPDDVTGFAHIYDRNGDGVIDSDEAYLRALGNAIFSAINEQGHT